MQVWSIGGMTKTWENRVIGIKPPSAILSTTHLTWGDPGSNPGLRGNRSVTNRLSYSTASVCLFVCLA